MSNSIQVPVPVPARYACPVCGKWGRSHHSNREIPSGYLFCNPKARTGGRGCGEIFKHRTVNACERIVFPVETMEAQRIERTIALGFRMVQSMKAAGVHDSRLRQCKWSDVYNYHWEQNGLCDCGCGQTKIAGKRFATSTCSGIFYDVAEMIARQGKTLLKFLVKLRGQRCESCGDEPKLMGYLEIDHIVEVANGGGMCWIDNFQLLCQKCHKEKTARFAAFRASQVRQLKEAKSPQLMIEFA